MPKTAKSTKSAKRKKVQYSIADQGRPKHSDVRSATSISDAFFDISMSLLGKGSIEKSGLLLGIDRFRDI